MPDVAVIGLGYVGLTLALALDEAGVSVVGYDIDQEKINKLKKQELWIHEYGLGPIMEDQNIKIPEKFEDILNARFVVVCVGTPSKSDGGTNLEYVFSCMRDIGKALITYTGAPFTIILKSTVPPGTSRKCIKLIEQISGKFHHERFGFVMSPEFLREGQALNDILQPDKIVIGYKYQNELKAAIDFYKELFRGWEINIKKINIITCNYENAEFIKYANNALLATKISFMNEIAQICETVPGADIKVIEEALGKDSRISNRFLRAGVGYGGSCFSKDIDALASFAKKQGKKPNLLYSIQTINEEQRYWATDILYKLYPLSERSQKKIAVLGLAFKPGTDDIRDSPAIKMIKDLGDFKIVVHDPEAMENAKKVLPHVEYAETAQDAIRDADCAIIMTDWTEYRVILPCVFVEEMKTPIMLDGRRIYDPRKMIQAGVDYYGVGRGRI